MECDIIQKQNEYIKELERKLALLTPKENMKDWNSIKNHVYGRVEEIFSDNAKASWQFKSAMTSMLGKILNINSVLAIQGDMTDEALHIANKIIDIAQEYKEGMKYE